MWGWRGRSKLWANVPFFWQPTAWWGQSAEWGARTPEDTSGALVHAHKQLHPHGDAGVPAQRQQADVAGHDGRAQQVLDGGGAVGVPIEDLQREREISLKPQPVMWILIMICFPSMNHEFKKVWNQQAIFLLYKYPTWGKCRRADEPGWQKCNLPP